MSLEGKAVGKRLKGRINSVDTLILSAYAVAVKNGYEGTEQEWLDSLKYGKDGHTPVKGVDYFTEEEKAEMVSDVLAALPTWEGGSY